MIEITRIHTFLPFYFVVVFGLSFLNHPALNYLSYRQCLRACGLFLALRNGFQTGIELDVDISLIKTNILIKNNILTKKIILIILIFNKLILGSPLLVILISNNIILIKNIILTKIIILIKIELIVKLTKFN